MKRPGQLVKRLRQAMPVAVMAVVLGPNIASAEVADLLAKAKDAYVEALRIEKDKFHTAFQSVNDALLKRDISADEKLKAARLIEREKQVFEETGYLPLSATMWASS